MRPGFGLSRVELCSASAKSCVVNHGSSSHSSCAHTSLHKKGFIEADQLKKAECLLVEKTR